MWRLAGCCNRNEIAAGTDVVVRMRRYLPALKFQRDCLFTKYDVSILSNRNEIASTKHYRVLSTMMAGTSSSAPHPEDSTDPGPPDCLSREEVACLKSALALVVVKRRLEERANAATKGAATPAALDNRSGSVEQGSAPQVSLCRPFSENTSSLSSSSDTFQNLGNWAHLDHMIRVALKSRVRSETQAQASSGTDPDGVTMHVACQLENVPLTPELEEWVLSYMQDLDHDSARLWADILRAKPSSTHVSSVVMSTLTKLLKDRLEGTEQESATAAESYALLDLLSRTLQDATVEDVQIATDALEDFSLPITDLATQYKAYRSTTATPASHLLLRWGLSTLLQNVAVSSTSKKRARGE